MGREKSAERNNNGVLVKVTTEYDGQGRVWRKSNPFTTATASEWTTQAYDTLGRVTSVTTPVCSQNPKRGAV